MVCLLALTGCGGGGTPAANQPSWEVTELQTQNENREVLKQQVEVRNCGEPEPQSVSCPAGTTNQFTYDLSETGHIPAALSSSVSQALGVSNANPTPYLLPVPPEGTVFQYELEKRFTVVRGEALAQASGGESTKFDYTFVADCTVTSDVRTALTCDGSPLPSAAEPTATATTVVEPSPTATSEPTATVTATPDLLASCDIDPAPVLKPLWDLHKESLGCASSELAIVPTIAEEAFEGGHMFWRSDNDAVYIVFDRLKDGTELKEGQWQLNPSWRRWDGTDPDGVGLNPPRGLVEPKRGFGWLWRNHLGAEDGPLGWALDKEYGFDNIGVSQEFDNGRVFKGSSNTVYILLDEGQFLTSALLSVN